MTDTEPRNAADLPGSENADWGHPGREAGSHHGSADPADDLTANTADASESVYDAGDDGPLPGDGVPGDGSVGRHPPSPDVDVVATVEKGREADAARTDTSDSTPTPTETPVIRAE